MVIKNKVVFIAAKCSTTGKHFFLREDIGADGMWVRTEGVTDGGSSTDSKNSKDSIVNFSNERKGPRYKCPHCGNKFIFFCNDCGVEVCCYDGGSSWYCPNSGKNGSFSNTQREIKISARTEKAQ